MEVDAITTEVPAAPESAHTSSRKSARSPRIELITRAAGRFARVEVKATRMLERMSQEGAIEAPSPVPQLLANPTARPSGRIEIVLADCTVVRMDAPVDEQALRRVLAALRG
jgi:hypothetical protein